MITDVVRRGDGAFFEIETSTLSRALTDADSAALQGEWVSLSMGSTRCAKLP